MVDVEMKAYSNYLFEFLYIHYSFSSYFLLQIYFDVIEEIDCIIDKNVSVVDFAILRTNTFNEYETNFKTNLSNSSS